jgi:hypothetical protein
MRGIPFRVARSLRLGPHSKIYSVVDLEVLLPIHHILSVVGSLVGGSLELGRHKETLSGTQEDIAEGIAVVGIEAISKTDHRTPTRQEPQKVDQTMRTVVQPSQHIGVVQNLLAWPGQMSLRTIGIRRGVDLVDSAEAGTIVVLRYFSLLLVHALAHVRLE